MKVTSIATRLTLLYAAAAVVVLASLGLYVDRELADHFDALDVARLEKVIDAARKGFDDQGRLAPSGREALSFMMASHPGVALVVVGKDREALFQLAENSQTAELIDTASQGTLGRTIIHAPERQVTLIAPLSNGSPIRIAAAKDGREHRGFMHELRVAFWSGIVSGILLLGAIGLVIARSSLRPVRVIADQARSITANRLDARIDIGATPAELHELVGSFNEMLDRLAGDFQRLSDFSADLAHELRTPLSNLLTQTQVALSRRRSIEEYQELLASNAEEFERMSRIISDLLFLAKADHGQIPIHASEQALRTIVERVWDYYSMVGEERGVKIEIEGEARFRGDQGLAERMIANLISNAVRHATPGTAIHAHLQQEQHAQEAVLTIKNQGEEIPAAALERVFDRFYRADPSRHGSDEHAGLGLAIARSIAKAHGGNITATSKEGETIFTVTLPA